MSNRIVLFQTASSAALYAMHELGTVRLSELYEDKATYWRTFELWSAGERCAHHLALHLQYRLRKEARLLIGAAPPAATGRKHITAFYQPSPAGQAQIEVDLRTASSGMGYVRVQGRPYQIGKCEHFRTRDHQAKINYRRWASKSSQRW